MVYIAQLGEGKRRPDNAGQTVQTGSDYQSSLSRAGANLGPGISQGCFEQLVTVVYAAAQAAAKCSSGIWSAK